MIFTSERIELPADEFSEPLTHGRYRCQWKGTVYHKGGKLGYDSVSKWLSNIEPRTVNEAAAELKGTYLLYLWDQEHQNHRFFVDPGGFYYAYRYENTIGTSFLELAKYARATPATLDPGAITEFLHYGNLYFQRTFLSDVKRIRADEIICVASDGVIKSEAKKTTRIEEPSAVNLSDYFVTLAKMLEDEVVSVDLTGGFDSRLVACLLKSLGTEIELTLSGTERYSDINIARNVASTMGQELAVTYHSPEWDESYLRTLFRHTDAMGDLLNFHRLDQYHSARRDRGITLAISSSGGELYKDFWWLQDFPFYARTKSNIERLYDLRIEPLRFPHQFLAPRLVDESRSLRDATIQELQAFKMGINTQTYDQIYYWYKMQTFAGWFMTVTVNHYLPVIAPLLDPELVSMGYSLPRSERFFNLFHRRLMTALCPRVARLQTTEGVSASINFGPMLLDFFRYPMNKGKRVAKKVSQRFLNTTRFQDNPNHPDLQKHLVRLPLISKLLQILKDNEILDKDITTDQIPSRLIGRFVTLGLLCETLGEA